VKLLVLVNNYQGDNSSNTDAALQRVLNAFSNYVRLDVDVVLFSTSDYQIENIVNVIFPTDLSYAFAYKPRQWLVENFYCLSHDYMMYMENDLIIPESSVLNCIEHMEYVSRFSEKFISGFIRFEPKNGHKEYIDMLPCVRPTVEKVLRAESGEKYWIPGNLHSGNFLLSRKQLDRMITSRKFQTFHKQYGREYYGILESAASDVYLEFVKVLPENFTTVEIEHVSNKYNGLTHAELSREIASPTGKIGC
jgi:hypothetical protein